MTAFRHLAPAGAPIQAVDLLRWAVAATTGDARRRFVDQLGRRVGLPHVHPTVTGRAGLTILLRALRTLGSADRREVVLPAYTCYSVAASVMKAGLTPRLVDITPDGLDFDRARLEAVDFSSVLAVVATNLYGLPSDLPWLSTLTRRHGVFLVDDAAQALGASVGGRPCGTWGDAGLYSFDKGKNVAAIDGGAVVTASDAVSAALTREMAALPAPGAAHEITIALKALVYFALLRPWLYWIPQRLPLGLGETPFTTDYPLAHASRLQLALATTMLGRLDQFTQARTTRAGWLLAALPAGGALTPIAPRPDTSPAYLRLPLVAASGGARDAIIRALNEAGVGATGSYPKSLADVPELASSAPVDNARRLAARILTVPTHPFVTAADVARIGAVLRDVTASAVPWPVEHATR